MILLGIIVGVGWVAFRLGLLIVRPLDRLAVGAERVAAGDLSVALPVVGSGEVASLTQVFNDMVKRLREGRAALNAANTALQEKNVELERLSVTDQLTGLYNRRRMLEVLENEVHRSKRLEHRFSVLMMDVDLFKKFNDSFGHQAGDRVLAGVAEVLRETTREIDTPARYGGEEFFAVLPEAGLDAAVEVAERIRATLASRIFEGRRVTLSIGVAEFPTHGADGDRLIAAADDALYRAKDEGRNRVKRAGAAA
jgi:diguanylate cyclase (GGDEF)-like protein